MSRAARRLRPPGDTGTGPGRDQAEGLALLEKLDCDPRIQDHYRLDAVRAHLLERSGNVAAALRYYEAAAEKTASLPEQKYLLLKITRLRAS